MIKPNTLSLNDQIVYDIIEPEKKVLDLGCGDGDLIHALAHSKKARVQGIEISDEAIVRCVEKGLSVYHDDIDSGLSEYPDKSFDYVVLNQSLQEVKQVDFVLKEALRVGEKAIIVFPNFAQIQARLQLLLEGRAPVAGSLPYEWHNTPNLRFMSIDDFDVFCRSLGFQVLKRDYAGFSRMVRFWPNLFAAYAIFVITK